MWFRPLNESSISTPAVLVYPDRIEENIRRMIAIAGDPGRLRPHVKTHKTGEIVRLQVEQGITRFKCATLPEMEMVAASGGKDILLAYPLMGPGTRYLFQLMEKFPEVRFSVTVDSREGCNQLAEQAIDSGRGIDLFVDIDNGMHRTGVEPEKAMVLVDGILEHPALTIKGLHIYDGHIHDREFEKRRLRCDRDFEIVQDLIGKLETKGVKIAELACGGTPTFPVHALYGSRTLCPGTTLLWDARYAAAFPDLDFLNAAVVAGRVVSRPNGNICLDLGHKSVASEMPHPRVEFMEMEIRKFLNHSDEHLVVETDRNEELPEGAVVYALPVHICPTMALHDRIYVIRDRKVTGTWQVVARGRSYFL